MITIKSSSAIDTNVIIYCFDEDLSSAKKLSALNIINQTPYFSSQVLSEVINIFHKRLKYSKINLIRVSNFLLQNCKLQPVTYQNIDLAHQLIQKYDFQYFDALIVSSAIISNCTILYSEDMQHNMFVEKQLIINNPFL